MRNIVIIAICGLLVVAAGMLIVFGGDMFDGGNDRDRRETVAGRDTAEYPDSSDRGDREPHDEAASADDRVGDAKAALSSGDIEAQLQIAVAEVNAQAPIRIDPLTEMTGARAEGRRLIYRYEIARELTDQQAADFENLASRQNRETLCANPQSRQLFDLGAEVEYVYFDPSGDRLFSTPITGC